jgi:hypothetical protein
MNACLTPFPAPTIDFPELQRIQQIALIPDLRSIDSF